MQVLQGGVRVDVDFGFLIAAEAKDFRLAVVYPNNRMIDIAQVNLLHQNT
jgi:hypothetical protein